MSRTSEVSDPYRLLFRHNPQPMWVYDTESLRFLAVNDAAFTQYGYSREEFLNMGLPDIRPPEDVPALEENLRRAGAEMERTGTWRHRRRDGSLIQVQIHSNTLTFEGRPGVSLMVGGIGIMNVMLVSVTERTRDFFGFYPAWKASRLDPIEALRRE